MPVSCLLVGVGDFEEGFFGKGLADNLHAYRQPVGKAGWDGDSRHASNVYWQGADVTQVHLQWVIYLLPDFEWDGGGGGGYQGIKLFEHLIKLSSYQGTNLLRLEVVSIIVASGQGIGFSPCKPCTSGETVNGEP